MSQIIKRFITRDPRGRPLAVQTERLSDDGQGRLQLRTERSAGWCSGCHRPVADLAELRGICDSCRACGSCVHCLVTCQLCGRKLCGRCRRGFAGPPPLSVCPRCLLRLHERQVMEHRMAFQQQWLERQRMVQQERARIAGLNLAAQRLRIFGQVQAARLAFQRELARAREMNRVRLALWSQRR